MYSKSSKVIAGLAVAAFVATALSAAATAQSGTDAGGSDIDQRAAEADELGVFIFGVDDPAIDESGEQYFYHHGPISEDTLVIIPTRDGQYPGGFSEEELRALAEEGGVEAVREAVERQEAG